MKKNINIYVIEDDKMTAELVSNKLKQEFHAEVSVYENMQDALTNVILYQPDLIITDYQLDNTGEEPNGIHLMKQLKRRQISIPSIMLSGAIDKGLALEVLNHGACDYVLKSGNYIPTLMESVRNIILCLKIKKDIVDVRHQQLVNMTSLKTIGLMSFSLIILALVLR